MRPPTNQVRVEDDKADNLNLHHRMYERRLRLLRERGGLSEDDATDEANDPTLFEVDKPEEAQED